MLKFAHPKIAKKWNEIMAKQYDVVIIGAGPAGSVAALLLRQQGFSVCVIEKQHFPRYVVGESLLPLGMDVLEEAGVLHIIENEPFQLKNGIAFTYQNHYTAFDFRHKHGKGKNFALQVDRARFDQILIHQAQQHGADVHFGETVISMDNSAAPVQLKIQQNSGIQYDLHARFVLDASGYFRAVPRLLGWEITQGITQHNVYHTQINDRITHPKFDRNKNLIAVHPEYRDIWMWLIPLDNQRSSVGLVGQARYFKQAEDQAGRLLGASELLKKYFGEVPLFQKIMPQAEWDNGFPFHYIPSYSADVQANHGNGFALLGNAAGFLDPVFSSGISSAMYSAKLAVEVLTRQLNGEKVDWQSEYASRQGYGAQVFKTSIDNWYNGSLQDWVFNPSHSPESREMLCAVLAGYAWDSSNPYVRDAQLA